MPKERERQRERHASRGRNRHRGRADGIGIGDSVLDGIGRLAAFAHLRTVRRDGEHAGEERALIVAEHERIERVRDVVGVEREQGRRDRAGRERRVVRDLEPVGDRARDRGPVEADDLAGMERRVGLGRPERGRRERARSDAGHGEAPRRGERALYECAAHRLHVPEVRAVRETAQRILRRPVGGVLEQDRGERGRGAHLPVVGDDAARIRHGLPRECERLGDAGAVGGSGCRRGHERARRTRAHENVRPHGRDGTPAATGRNEDRERGQPEE